MHVKNLDGASSKNDSNLLDMAVEKAVEDWGAASRQKICGTYPTEDPVGEPGDVVGAGAGPLPNTAVVVKPSEAGAGVTPHTGSRENPDALLRISSKQRQSPMGRNVHLPPPAAPKHLVYLGPGWHSDPGLVVPVVGTGCHIHFRDLTFRRGLYRARVACSHYPDDVDTDS